MRIRLTYQRRQPSAFSSCKLAGRFVAPAFLLPCHSVPTGPLAAAPSPRAMSMMGSMSNMLTALFSSEEEEVAPMAAAFPPPQIAGSVLRPHHHSGWLLCRMQGGPQTSASDSPEAWFGIRSRLRLPQDSASLGQSAAPAALPALPSLLSTQAGSKKKG